MSSSSRQAHSRARVLAFYLPQYYPIPENDAWWGKGFTEWTNVTKAQPLYRGHVQPQLPADLGFYDLRVPETREAQATLARANGVEGFCYWHYWFGNGNRILERPFAEVLRSGEPDFPFCLAWANVSWSGIWCGDPGRELVNQTYPGSEDERAHFISILPALRDPRYVRVAGKPVFVVFAPAELPDPAAFVDHWRRLAYAEGLPGLYLVAITNDLRNARFDAFDAITPLPPQDFIERRPSHAVAKLKRLVNERNFGRRINARIGNRFRLPRRFDYREVVQEALRDLPSGRRFLPCVIPNWDNTPRSGAFGVVYEHASPQLFGEYLEKAVNFVQHDHPAEERIVFLKAWNEWAEGNYVEPDRRYGTQWLDAMRAVLYADGNRAMSEPQTASLVRR